MPTMRNKKQVENIPKPSCGAGIRKGEIEKGKLDRFGLSQEKGTGKEGGANVLCIQKGWQKKMNAGPLGQDRKTRRGRVLP